MKASNIKFIFEFAETRWQLMNMISSLTLSSIYTHFNTLKKKLQENIVEKGEIAQNEQYHLFPQCFLYNLCRKIL